MVQHRGRDERAFVTVLPPTPLVIRVSGVFVCTNRSSACSSISAAAVVRIHSVGGIRNWELLPILWKRPVMWYTAKFYTMSTASACDLDVGEELCNRSG